MKGVEALQPFGSICIENSNYCSYAFLGIGALEEDIILRVGRGII
ncbi:MAG TPA: hypothetical protein VMV04_08715 [Thermodesulfobacteriota bacterium]|nr:hypothetical protein [Thermodesulfobacteriota bacterium]